VRFQEKIKNWIQTGIFNKLPGSQPQSSIYLSKKKFTDPGNASLAFLHAREKLFNINGWNNVRTLGKTVFTLFEENGKISKAVKAKVGQYIRISSSGPFPPIWVMIHEVFEGFNMAEFIVRPAASPLNHPEPYERFYTSEATGVFRVTLSENVLQACKEGNNDDTLFENTYNSINSPKLVALNSAWYYYQKYRWKHLTDYLIH